MAEIFNSLAAYELGQFVRLHDNAQSKRDDIDTRASNIVDYLTRADNHARVNEYTWLIKGFYELRQGMV